MDQQVTINVIEGPDRESMVPIGLSTKVDGSDGSAQIEVSIVLHIQIKILCNYHDRVHASLTSILSSPSRWIPRVVMLCVLTLKAARERSKLFSDK